MQHVYGRRGFSVSLPSHLGADPKKRLLRDVVFVHGRGLVLIMVFNLISMFPNSIRLSQTIKGF